VDIERLREEDPDAAEDPKIVALEREAREHAPVPKGGPLEK